MNTCGLCGKSFPSHTALAEHIFDVHGSNSVNWNARFVALALALLLVLHPVWNHGNRFPASKPDVSWCPSCKG